LVRLRLLAFFILLLINFPLWAISLPQYTLSVDDSVACADNSHVGSKTIVTFDHSDKFFDYYLTRLHHFSTDFQRHFFYQSAREKGFYISDKNDYYSDSALFITTWYDLVTGLIRLNEIVELTVKAEEEWSESEKTSYLGSSPFRQPTSFMEPLDNGIKDGTVPCESASVSCSGNTYTFPANTSGTAPTPTGNPPYPNYGCLSSVPCPVWYYMQVGQAGDIIIDISQSGGMDVDFICWGPFNSLSEGCEFGLTGTCNIPGKPPCCNNNSMGCTNFYPRGNMVDCSYSGLANETCHILNAQVGEIYILLMTNFSQQPTTLTFS